VSTEVPGPPLYRLGSDKQQCSKEPVFTEKSSKNLSNLRFESLPAAAAFSSFSGVLALFSVLRDFQCILARTGSNVTDFEFLLLTNIQDIT
jgi:hypothetical protein